MSDFNDLKGAILNTIGTVAGKTRDFADKAADKAKDVARIAKLNMELSSEKDTIEKAYLEIGKLYYETRRNSPDGFFVQLCDEITLANGNISKILSELDDLKVGLGVRSGDIQVEFTDVCVDETAEKPTSDEDFVKEGSAGEDVQEKKPEAE